MAIRAVEGLVIGIIVAIVCAVVLLGFKTFYEARANDIAEMRDNQGLCQSEGCALRARLLGYETPAQTAARTQQ